SGTNEPLEHGLLLIVQYIAGREQERDDFVFGEHLVLEDEIGILGPKDAEMMFLAQVLDRIHAGVDRIVMPACRFREEQDIELLRDARIRPAERTQTREHSAEPVHLLLQCHGISAIVPETCARATSRIVLDVYR